MDIYFNPNWNPLYFYPLIKPLTLIYDQITVWSPVQSRLEDAGFATDDFLKATQSVGNQAPIIVPVARESWLKPDYRRSYPDPECRIFDKSFEEKIYQVAKRGKGILSTDDLNVGYQALDEVWNDPDIGRPNIEKIAEETLKEFSSSMVVQIETTADKLNKPLRWAVANAFIQDARAITVLGVGAPLVPLEYARGYLCLSPSQEFEVLPAESVKNLRRRLINKEELPELPSDIVGEEILQFLNDAFNASKLSWDEIIELRKSKRHQIRAWLNENLEHHRRPLNKTISEIAAVRTNQMYKKAKFQTTGVIAALLGGVALQLDLPAAIITGGLVTLLSMTRLHTPIVKSAAKRLGYKTDRFLVDTPFFTSAELNNG